MITLNYAVANYVHIVRNFSTSCVLSYSDGMKKFTMCIASQIVSTAINTMMLFQYVNIVLIVKQRYHHVKHLFSEADSTTKVDT